MNNKEVYTLTNSAALRIIFSQSKDQVMQIVQSTVT